MFGNIKKCCIKQAAGQPVTIQIVSETLILITFITQNLRNLNVQL